jgi:diacylglycerol kinase family enzyme
MPGIGIISNPHAKVNRNDPEHNTLIWYVLGNRGRFEVTGSLDDLGRVCQSFQERGIDHVAIVGGDGTITRTLTAILRSYGEESLPRILLLRGGTVNVLATNLGIYGQPKDILSDILDFFHSNNPLHEMKVRSLTANGELGFLLGTGGAVRFLEAFYANKTSAWGAGAFFGSVLLDGLSGGHFGGKFESLAAPEPLELSYSWNGATETVQTSTTVLLAASIPKLPYGLEYFPDLALRTDCGEAMYTVGGGRGLVRDIALSLLSKQKSHKNIKKFKFDQLDITLPNQSSFTLDGEILDSKHGKVKVQLGPVFRFCSPYGKILGT